MGEADDEHLRNIVDYVFEKYGRENIRSFWLAGHSQGGMTSNRLLNTDPFFKERVDGWLSLSGGRIGPIELPASFFVPVRGPMPAMPQGSDAPRPGKAVAPDCDISFIFATGEHEMVALPETSPWAEKYGAGQRVRLADVIDDKPGQIHDTMREGKSTPAWGLLPGRHRAGLRLSERPRRPRHRRRGAHGQGTHGGLEPKVTEELLRMVVGAPGGKASAAKV